MIGKMAAILLVLLGLGLGALRAQEPGAILTTGSIAEAEAALSAKVKAGEGGDATRVALGLAQFLRAYEKVGATLYKYGLRTENASEALGMFAGQLMPENPTPEVATLAGLRAAADLWLKDLAQTEQTLAAVKDAEVKLVFVPGLLQIDPSGLGHPVSAVMLLANNGAAPTPNSPALRAVAFDRGDVTWLRGYLHMLMGLGEMVLAYDQQELFDTVGHMAFAKTNTPYQYLLTEDRNFDAAMEDFGMGMDPVFLDIIALIHLQRYALKEPERCPRALAHFEAMAKLSQEMWTQINAEVDDDREWIPNPRQNSVIGRKITEAQITAWKGVMVEVQSLLAGKTLLPFWRGTDEAVGINLRRVFLEPKAFDTILWIQGTAATPYLEAGKRTPLSQPNMMRQLSQAFGGNLWFFALWTN